MHHKIFNSIHKLKPNVIFSVFVILLLLSGNVQHVIFLRPQSEHQWRQCDAASQSLNYYQNKVPFFTPQYHTLYAENGHGASEFPIVYYFISKLYSLFGFHEYLHRATTLILFLLGLWFLYKTALLFISNKFLALLPVIFLGTSPVYFFYADNFLPNVHAISFSLIGFYHFAKYLKSEKIKYIYLFTFFFTLAGLIKISESSGFIAIQCLFLLSITGLIKTFPVVFKKHLLHKIITCLFFVVCIIGWNVYALALNKEYHNFQSLLGIIPIWEMNTTEIKQTCLKFFEIWLPEIHSIGVWIFILISLLYFIIQFKKLHPVLK